MNSLSDIEREVIEKLRREEWNGQFPMFDLLVNMSLREYHDQTLKNKNLEEKVQELQGQVMRRDKVIDKQNGKIDDLELELGKVARRANALQIHVGHWKSVSEGSSQTITRLNKEIIELRQELETKRTDVRICNRTIRYLRSLLYPDDLEGEHEEGANQQRTAVEDTPDLFTETNYDRQVMLEKPN